MTGQTFLITGARAPVALHMARLLAGAGHAVHLADSLQAPLAAASRLHHGYHVLPSFRWAPEAAARTLQDLIARLGVDRVIPTCEEVLYLGQIWRDRAMPAPLFAPDAALLEEVHNKYHFIDLCRRIGLAAPETRLLQHAQQVMDLAPQANGLVFKPVWSRFATQTVVRPGPRALTRIRPSPGQPWVAQDFVAGQELCVHAMAEAGRVTALAAYRGLIRAGLGASVCFAPVQDAALDRFVATFVRATGWTGQISFDVIRTSEGTILPIECNPRATSGLHFFRDCAGFSAALLGQRSIAPDVTEPQGVRLAVWVYGLQTLGRPGGVSRFRSALKDVQDVITDWPGDRLTLADQLRPMAEIARIALRDRISLQAAATRDIEWNGPDQSRM